MPPQHLIVLATLAALFCTSEAQVAGIQQPCTHFNSPLTPQTNCDLAKGLQCQNYHDTQLRREVSLCNCYDPFVYDQASSECRRPLGYPCRVEQNATIYNTRSWFDKCPQDAACIHTPPSQRRPEALARHNGQCACRTGEGWVQRGSECHAPRPSPPGSAINFGDGRRPPSRSPFQGPPPGPFKARFPPVPRTGVKRSAYGASVM